MFAFVSSGCAKAVRGRGAAGSARRFLRVVAGGAGRCEIFTDEGTALHPQWLRERCLAPSSVQIETNQPLLQPHEYVWPMVIDHAEFDHENTLLRVRFGDGHETSYNVQDLELEARAPAEIGIQQRDIQMPTPILWRDEQPKRYAFADLVDESTLEVEELGRTYMDWEDYRIPVTSARNMFELTERLLTHGHVIVTGVPSRHMMVSAFAQCVTRFQGYSSVRATNWGPVFNVQSKPDANLHDLAYTSHALPPHVDNPYRDPNPGFQLLHALENKCFKTGGSIAVDGFEVARQLQEEDPELFRVLCEVPCRWENDGGDGSTALVFFGPHFPKNPSTGEVEQVRYSTKSGGYTPALVDSNDMDLLFRARRRFAELLNAESNTARFRVNEGEIWIFNNLRLLHGRAAFDTQEGNRHFQGAYIDVDGVQSAYFRSKYQLARE